MNLLQLNWLAVVVAFVAFFAIGALWFGPKTFYPVWARALGKTSEPGSVGLPMGVVYALTAIAAFAQVLVTAVVIHLLAAASGPVGPLAGAGVGLALGVCIAAAASLGHRLFSGQGLKVWLLEAGNDIVALTAAGLVIGLFG
jgi:hypothetical protein